jgi:hypothetical protein
MLDTDGRIRDRRGTLIVQGRWRLRVISKIFTLMHFCLLCSAQSICCNAQATPALQPLFSSGDQIPHLKNITFSESDRYVALEGDDLVIVFDLVKNSEVTRWTRETPLRASDPVNKPQSLTFDPQERFFIYRDGKLLKKCTFLVQGDCKTLAHDLAGGFDVSESGLLAYRNGSDELCIRPISLSAPCKFLPNPTPSADRNSFAIRYVRFSRDSKKVATVGVVDRSSRDEWRSSVYDVSKGITDISYEQLTFEVDDLRFERDNHLVACGHGRSAFGGTVSSGYVIWDITANQRTGATVNVKVGLPSLTIDASEIVVMNSATGVSKISVRTGENTILLPPDLTPPFNGRGSRLWISPSSRIGLYSNFGVPGKADIYRLSGLPPA